MSELEKRIQELESENELLRKELAYVKKELADERNRKIVIEQKFESAKEIAKDTAQKGLTISKDIFNTTKGMFQRTKDAFKEEWDRQKSEKELSSRTEFVGNQNGNKFSTLHNVPIEKLSFILHDETPEVISIVLSYLRIEQVQSVLDTFPLEQKILISQEASKLDTTSRIVAMSFCEPRS